MKKAAVYAVCAVLALAVLLVCGYSAGIAAFIVPYIFAYSPAMLFVNVTSVWAVLQIVLSALLGIFGVAAGLEGFMLRKMNWLFRLICIGGGLGLMIPGALSDLVGLVLIGGVFAIQYVQNKKEALSKD